MKVSQIKLRAVIFALRMAPHKMRSSWLMLDLATEFQALDSSDIPCVLSIFYSIKVVFVCFF